jgi:TRAP-type C4-dicarboxylate transport system permease small subunit
MKKTTLWIGIVGAPLVALAYLEVSYSLTPWACRSGQKSELIIGTLIALILSMAAALVAWRTWRVVAGTAARDESDEISRSRFMALAGLGVSALMALFIIASFLPIVVLEVCD